MQGLVFYVKGEYCVWVDVKFCGICWVQFDVWFRYLVLEYWCVLRQFIVVEQMVVWCNLLFVFFCLEVGWYCCEVFQFVGGCFKQMNVWIVVVQFFVYFILEFVLCLWGVLVWCLSEWDL